jgi:chemotaxis family two-component system sensor kinase Cph1
MINVNELNLTNCDREPIHIPSHTQPCGILLALQEPDFKIVQVSNNIEQFSDIKPEQLLSADLEMLLGKPQADFLKQQIVGNAELKALNPLSCVISKKKINKILTSLCIVQKNF